MNILIVGNVTKDVYLNLDTRTESLETDKADVKWLDLAFNASEHRFFNRSSNFGGAAVSLEVLQKMGLIAKISDSNLDFSDEQFSNNNPISTYRYILVADENVTYFAPSKFKKTTFTPPAQAVDYLYIDRSATLDPNTINQIKTYLELSPKTKLVLYIHDQNDQNLTQLIDQANLIFIESLSQSPLNV